MRYYFSRSVTIGPADWLVQVWEVAHGDCRARLSIPARNPIVVLDGYYEQGKVFGYELENMLDRSNWITYLRVAIKFLEQQGKTIRPIWKHIQYNTLYHRNERTMSESHWPTEASSTDNSRVVSSQNLSPKNLSSYDHKSKGRGRRRVVNLNKLETI